MWAWAPGFNCVVCRESHAARAAMTHLVMECAMPTRALPESPRRDASARAALRVSRSGDAFRAVKRDQNAHNPAAWGAFPRDHTSRFSAARRLHLLFRDKEL